MIITTAAGKLQDDSSTNSLESAVSLWLAYAFISTAVAGGLLLISYAAPTLLPAARLAEVAPRRLEREVDRLCARTGVDEGETQAEEKEDARTREKRRERLLKAPQAQWEWVRWLSGGIACAIVVLAWVVFGLGVAWGVHGSVIAGTVGD